MSDIDRSTYNPPFTFLKEESEYWSGYLLADGYFVENASSRQDQITLTSIDLEHIFKFIEYVGSDKKPYKAGGSDKQVWGITYASNSCVSFLDHYGVVSKIQISPLLAKSRHFWRGLIDGDGYVEIRNRRNGLKKGRCILSNNSPVILNQFKWFASPCFDNCSIRRDGAGYQIGSCSKMVEDLLCELYMDANIYLERKLESIKPLL